MLEKTYVVGYVSRFEPTQVWAMGRGVRHWCATPRSHVGTRLHNNTIQPPPWPSGLGRRTPCPCLKLRCAGGREFEPRPGQYSRMSFSSDQVTGTVFPHLKMPFLPNSEFI